MKRQEKYPDTSTFHYYNANPHNRITGDCWVRAICNALEIPYNQVVMEMAEFQCKTGYSAEQLIDRYLKSKDWVKQPQPKKNNGTKYTGKEFCKRMSCERTIANIGANHIVAIISGKVEDIWDSTDGCIGNYWIKRGK